MDEKQLDAQIRAMALDFATRVYDQKTQPVSEYLAAAAQIYKFLKTEDINNG